MSPRRRRLGAGAAVTLAAVLLTTACQQTETSTAGRRGAGESAALGTAAAAGGSEAKVGFSWQDGDKGVAPDTVLAISAASGHLTKVSVIDEDGRVLAGSLADDGTRWTSAMRLGFSHRIRATVEARDRNDRVTAATSRLRTVKPRATLTTSITPLDGSVVGVGMPVIVRFSRPVVDRAAAERRLSVTSSVDVTGGWNWVSSREVHYRPRAYWPAHTRVTLRVKGRDLLAGHGVWGRRDRTVTFRTGAAQIGTVDVAKHTLTVRRDGELVRTIPVTTGKAGFLTRGGTKVIISKEALKIMDARTIGIQPGTPEYYRLEVPYAMRVTWSGEFVHAAPWSVASQGRANVSHGCVGLSVANGRWYFDSSRVGDVVKVINSNRSLEPGNGWTDWNVSWTDWKAGSAL